jgi:hypothetical protein
VLQKNPDYPNVMILLFWASITWIALPYFK